MSGLEDLYREIILDHYRNPRNRGKLEVPPSHRVEAYNPLCGDEVAVYLQVHNGVLQDIKIEGQGCSISQSSASLMSAAVKGKRLEEIEHIIKDFKSLMSIHEVGLGVSDDVSGAGHPGEAETGVGSGSGSGSGSGENVDDATSNADGGIVNYGDDYIEDTSVDLDSLGELAALQGVVRFPVRIKCAVLGWNALAQGLEEIATDAR